MPASRSHQGRIFWGMFIIFIGVLFLLDRLGELDFGDLISRYWPFILIIIGLSILIGNNFRNVGSGLFFIILGAIFFLAKLEVFDHNVWYYLWPFLVIGLGLWLLVKPAFRRRKENFPKVKDDDLDISAVFSAVKRRIESKNFRGGSATSVFGGIELDFSNAGLAGGQATIELTAILGGIEIRVPREWQVVIDGTPILGGIDDKKRTLIESEKKATLYVKATAILGGIEIKD